ncbi:type III secretion system cytoplasmic ring protein SctQ [Pseudomonas sp. CFBP 8771]|uniref:type III secretion system cytoplasmic ring protein SctQ n=1 Tax=unclassified Pseudomonas TaxID=196821 RepID=UPI00177CFC4F|nr:MULTISPECIES: type III secretion system cytoplasmic ring protein SctQ [unclassified Pseudomonas]MBD8601330.1 type III secretion system cytoplasmic ring protein SctQ [Pseudomonas sp. CFBP 8771]MBD8827843.1 type III secretion system cytoplasmic ring protein SctQ [Pseudomonas sp. CFBP 13602]
MGDVRPIRPAQASPAPVLPQQVLAHFPRVDATAWELINQWLHPRAVIEFALGGHACQLAVRAWPEALDDRLDVAFSLGQDAGALYLPMGLLDSAFGTETSTSLQQASPEQRCLLLEYLLLDLVEALEKLTTQPLQCVPEPTAENTLPVRLGLAVSQGAWHATLGLALDPGAAQRLLALLDTQVPRVPEHPGWLPLPVSVACGWQRLSLDELHSLAPGDVVMLDRPCEGVLVSIAERLHAFATLIPGGLRLDDSPSPASFPFLSPSSGESTMAQSPEHLAAHLPVTLVCEVGHLEVTVQTLGALVCGSVLPLPDREGQHVMLHANGKAFGQGELVTLGEGLGVRLTSRAAHE